MPTPPKVKATVTNAEDSAWVAHARQDRQKTPERLEEAAKFLTGLVGVCLTIFISNPPAESSADHTNLYVAAALLWALALLLSAFVLFPWPYQYIADDPDSIRAAYQRVVKTKRWLLIVSMAAFLLGLGLASGGLLGGSIDVG